MLCFFRSLLLVAWTLVLASPTERIQFKSAHSTPAISRLRKAMDSAIPAKKDLEAGAIAVSLDSNEIVYQRNESQLLIPASVSKVFTAYAALKRLKPSGTFKTQLYIVGPVGDGRLNGDLYIKGGGDPSLVSERMWMIVNEFLRSGIKTITGNIVGDSSYYDEETRPQSRPRYLKDQAYNAPVGALSFNFNTTTVYVKPGEKVENAPIVYTDPRNSYIEIVNQATTGKAGSKNTIVTSRIKEVKGDIGDTVLLRGSIPADHAEIRYYRNIVNPTLYATHMFKTFLEAREVKVGGHALEGRVPENAKQILEFDSPPMWQIVWGMNKFSNNFVADQVLKKIGAEIWGSPGTLSKGVSAVEELLEDTGIARKTYQIQDGSGLTRNTRVSALQVLTVLVAAYRDFAIAPEFLASLGTAGEDGTLRRRFPNSNAKSVLRAKTGSLDGVDALAGYTVSADKEKIAFVILLNNPGVKYGKMTAWVDRAANALSQFSRK